MNKLVMCVALSAAMMLAVAPVRASLVDVETLTPLDSIQDEWIIQGEVDELGINFPSDEKITATTVDWENHIPCPSEYDEDDDGAMVQVAITNLTGRDFTHVYYVADPNTTMTNWDEKVGNAGEDDHCLAFRIDDDGVNTPLVSESLTEDGIFEDDETWEFVIQKFVNSDATGAAAFESVGIAGDSDELTNSSASIIVPEPATMSLLALGGLALLRRKRR